MRNIIFLDREKEIRTIEEIKKENFFIVIKGRRRIGKTTFLRKCFPDSAYLFIWPNKSLDWINNKICEENKLPLFRNFVDILNYLLDKNKVVIIDEFQNFLSVDKSIYGEMQKLIDERKSKKFMKIAIAGSSYSLINRVFNDSASPLYGRRTAEITLSHLPIKDLFKELRMDLEDFIELWSIFEGIPYYYELIDSSINAEENLKKLVLSKDALLQDEGKAVLSVEFGQDSKTYNTVISAIAEGKTKINEIASLFDNKVSETVKYLNILRSEFKLVKRITPVLSDPRKSKEGRYEIVDNFLNFWFYFVDRQRSYIEQERFEEVDNFFIKNINTFVGKKFEKFIIGLVKDKIINLDFEIEKIGKQWGKIGDAEKDKNQYEIDIVALNEEKKEILFGECKWKDKVDALEVVKDTMEKASYIDWNKEARKESYAVFSKSFSKKIKEFEGKKVYCFDLKDIGKLMKRKGLNN